ncbi:MAG TPA: glycosyltransferase family 39 protein, partial [Sphingomicrobium sp.]
LLKAKTLNPGWFGHPGSTTIYLIALCTMLVYAVGWLAGVWATSHEFLTAIYANPALIMVPQRMMIAIPGLITVWLVYRIGRDTHSARVGLIAAAILALSPLHIELSQLIRTDVQMAMFVMASVYCALPLREGIRFRPLVSSAIFAGLACATKWPGIIILLVPLSLTLNKANGLRQKLGYAAIGLLVAIAALVVSSPYILIDYQTVLGDVLIEGRPRHLSQTSLGKLETLGTYLFVVIPAALGWPAAIFSAAGLALALGRGRRSRLGIVLVLPALAFLALISLQSIMWPRWAVPVLPFLCLFAAIAANELLVRLTSTRRHRASIAIALALTLYAPLAIAARDGARERSNETRDQALRWIARNVPAGASLAVETPAIALLHGPWELRYPLGDLGCVDPRRAMAGGVDYDDVARATGDRININLATIAPTKVDSCKADFIMVNELDRYSAEAHYYPAELAVYRALLANTHEVAQFAPRSGEVGGSTVRIYAR